VDKKVLINGSFALTINPAQEAYASDTQHH